MSLKVFCGFLEPRIYGVYRSKISACVGTAPAANEPDTSLRSKVVSGKSIGCIGAGGMGICGAATAGAGAAGGGGAAAAADGDGGDDD